MELFTVKTTKVKRKFNPYTSTEVMRINALCNQEFGRYGVRWGFAHANPDNADVDAWTLEYWFKDPNDALIFALKHLESV
jgi:hypothetical protein